MDNNINEEIKKSPYLGINDPEIRKKYEEEFNKPNYPLMNGLILMFICSIAFLFIISDTFKTYEIPKDDDNKKENLNAVTTQIQDDDISDLVNLDLSTINVIDNTSKVTTDLVIDANYLISDFTYSMQSLKVPYINIAGEDARLVNEEIKNNFKTWALESAKYIKAYTNKNIDVSNVIRTKYEVYTYNNVLSVLICFTKRENSLESYYYYSYAFDISNDSNEIKILSNNDLNNVPETTTVSLTSTYGKKLNYQEVINKLELNFEEVDTKYTETLKLYSGEYGELQYIEDTLNLYNEEKQNMSFNAFINNDGMLCLISKIYTPLYENGTFRVFRYNEGNFESVSNN